MPRNTDEIRQAASALESGDENQLLVEITAKGRWMTRAVSPFIHLPSVLYAGMPGDQVPSDVDLALYQKVLKIHPKFCDLLEVLAGNEDSSAMERFISQLEFYLNDARSQDINTIRYTIIGFIPVDPHQDVINPPIAGSRKDNRGWRHNATAAALCPLKYRAEFDVNPIAFRQKVETGEVVIRAKDFPSFLYPHGTMYDLNAIDEGLFRGHIFIRTFRAIYTGKSSAIDGKRTASSSSLAEKNLMRAATPETIAYAAIQAYFGLSNLERWSEIGNDTFDYERFFQNCLRLVQDQDDPWVVETLQYITRETPSLNRRRPGAKLRASIESEDEGSNDEATLILQQRAARRATAATVVIPINDMGEPLAVGERDRTPPDDNFQEQPQQLASRHSTLTPPPSSPPRHSSPPSIPPHQPSTPGPSRSRSSDQAPVLPLQPAQINSGLKRPNAARGRPNRGKRGRKH